MSNRPWEQRDETARKRSARKMEVFAAMVENMDHNIGRVLDHLEATGQRENTIIFFLSDNGAEGTQLEAAPANRNVIPTMKKYFDNSLENLGMPNSYCCHPGSEYQGKNVQEMLGKSWNSYMMGESESIHDEDTITGWEFLGRQALRKGTWKIVRLPKPWGTGEWEMFNLAEDLAEDINLRDAYPERFVEMLGHWTEYAKKHGVVDIKTVETAYALQEEEWTESDLEDIY
ncbi:unnamed protein product [Parascedosporium putredinis]|uniref:Sulfatase N-terminal domain-containing protein n=1 Tax=Parascedosporium putredinis TaxID=1442378 RepID=A0A9P1H0A3_9PEZI|nr:unnamed protein product [Parascedosporium putredinis]CAI7992584.1 unnamed protein product [Parascedosporium putredinis]